MDVDSAFSKAFKKWKKDPFWFAGVGILGFIIIVVAYWVFMLLGFKEIGAILGVTGFWIVVIAGQEGRKKFTDTLKKRWLDIGVAGLVAVLPLMIGVILFLFLYMISKSSPLLGLAGVFVFVIGFAVTSAIVLAPYRATREDWETAVKRAYNLGKNNFATLFLVTFFFATSFFFLAGVDPYFAAAFNTLFFYHIIAGVYYELAFSRRTTREA